MTDTPERHRPTLVDLPDTPPPVRRGRTPRPDKRGGDRHTANARMEVAMRRRRVIELRQAGLSWTDIAEQTGYADPSGARLAWNAAVAEVAQPLAREALDLELQRLDTLQAAVWSKAAGGNLAAVDQALKVMAARAKLLGLNGAVKIDVTQEGASEQVREAAAELAALLAAHPQAQA